jgi:hypothetical protein
MAKRVREFQSVSFEQQLKAFKPLRGKGPQQLPLSMPAVA